MTTIDQCPDDRAVRIGNYCVTTHLDAHGVAVVDRTSTTADGTSFFSAVQHDAFLQLPPSTSLPVSPGASAKDGMRALTDYLNNWISLCHLVTDSVELRDYFSCATVGASISAWSAHGDVIDAKVASPRQWKVSLRAGAVAVGGTLDERRLNRFMWSHLRRELQGAIKELRAIRTRGDSIGPEEDAAYKRLGNLTGMWLREGTTSERVHAGPLRRTLASFDDLLPQVPVMGVD